MHACARCMSICIRILLYTHTFILYRYTYNYVLMHVLYVVSVRCILTHNYTIELTLYTCHTRVIYTVIPNLQATEADEELFEDNPTDYIRKDMEGSDIGKMGVYVCVCVYIVYVYHLCMMCIVLLFMCILTCMCVYTTVIYVYLYVYNLFNV